LNDINGLTLGAKYVGSALGKSANVARLLILPNPDINPLSWPYAGRIEQHENGIRRRCDQGSLTMRPRRRRTFVQASSLSPAECQPLGGSDVS
jgi:hypothetical protein